MNLRETISSQRFQRALWTSDGIATTIINNEFWGIIETLPPSVSGQIKVWLGSMLAKPVKFWNGIEWVTVPVKKWNGSSWEETNY